MRKKEYIGCLIVLVLMYAWALPGCGRQDGTFYETTQRAETENRTDAGSDHTGEDAVMAGNDGNAQEEDAAEVFQNVAPQQFCYVHICGAVRYPGVYEVAEGSRLYEVIVLAGGLCADACDYLVNQAQAVTDGMQIYIPTVQEIQTATAGGQDLIPAAEALPGTGGQDVSLETGNRDTRIDLNSATKEQFMTLPGIGETRAEAIIAYREAHGGFAAIEELMEVSGIKQGVYDRLKEMIKV